MRAIDGGASCGVSSTERIVGNTTFQKAARLFQRNHNETTQSHTEKKEKGSKN